MKSSQLAHMDQLATQTQQAGALFQKSTDGVRQANPAARQVQVEGNLTGEDAVTLPGNKRPTPFGKARIATEGTNSLFGTGGWVDRLVEKAQQGEYETVAQLADDTLKRLDKWSTTSVNAANDPAWQALRTQIDQLGKSAKAMVEIRKQTSREAHGAAKGGSGTSLIVIRFTRTRKTRSRRPSRPRDRSFATARRPSETLSTRPTTSKDKRSGTATPSPRSSVPARSGTSPRNTNWRRDGPRPRTSFRGKPSRNGVEADLPKASRLPGSTSKGLKRASESPQGLRALQRHYGPQKRL